MNAAAILILCLVGYSHYVEGQYREGYDFERNGGGDSKTYDWGYMISPTRGHAEKKDKHGVVTGIVSFVNPNGNNVQWRYTAQPHQGFEVTEYLESPVKRNPFIDPQSLAINARPLLKDSRLLGYVRAEGFEGSQAQFRVDDQLVHAAGSESQLAHNLGAIPVAVVHDGRGSPYRGGPRSPPRPVLVSKRPQDVSRGGGDYYLMVAARK